MKIFFTITEKANDFISNNTQQKRHDIFAGVTLYFNTVMFYRITESIEINGTIFAYLSLTIYHQQHNIVLKPIYLEIKSVKINSTDKLSGFYFQWSRKNVSR